MIYSRDFVMTIAIIFVIALVFGMVYLGTQPPPIGYGYEPKVLNDVWGNVVP